MSTKKRPSHMQHMQKFIYNDCEVPHQMSRMVILSLIRYITAELQRGDDVVLNGLGMFFLTHRKWYSTAGKTRKWVNGVWVEGPTKIRVHPAADYPMFRASAQLRRQIHKVRKPDYGKPTDEVKHE